MTAFDATEQDLIVRCPDPFNAETPPDKLIASFVTPQAHFYIRSHGPMPALAGDHPLALVGLVDRPRSYTLDELDRIPDARSDGDDAVRRQSPGASSNGGENLRRSVGRGGDRERDLDRCRAP